MAADNAIRAARDAVARLGSINAAPPEDLRHIDHWRPLSTGIALHRGNVFFGNIGSSQRLDFTVIGRAVNETSRVEALTKEIGYPIVITEPVAQLLDCGLRNLGHHALRGVSEPVTLFTPSPP